MTLTEDELARLAELEDLLTVGLVEQPINGSVLSWGEAALIAHRIGRHLLRATPVADTAGIDAGRLTQALNNTMDARANIAVFRVAPESLNHAAARLIAAEYAALRTPKPEGD